MDIEEYFKILDSSNKRIRDNTYTTTRFLLDKIDWRDRLICVSGSRGCGKTTLILQHIRSAFNEDYDKALYVSLDNLWFANNSLSELVDMHYKNGGTHIFLDEVHYLRDWQIIIKNLYDEYPKMKIVYTGSSLLKIDYESGDLSRRQVTYHLPGLSFREYLFFENIIDLKAIGLNELLADHKTIAEKIAPENAILKHFSEYLMRGYYPFYREVYAGYDQRLSQITNQILESDYPAVEKINYSTVKKIKKMLFILAQSCPQTPKMTELYAQLETDRNQGLKMLNILDKANLLNILSSEKASLKNMARPDKIYCDNPNIMYSLTERINVGTKRETFFLNQLRSAGYDVLYPNSGDFLVEEKYLFEVGGKDKRFDQIKDIPNSFLAIDDVEIGRGNRIPLWMFGLLY
ncbi:MAG: ATP-binding protein [Lachnospiraceae bacterium]|nr:ATP-binding protein [Lachnospiraceae bacterium]